MYSKSDDKPLNFDVPYFQTAAKCHFFVVNGRVSSVVSLGGCTLAAKLISSVMLIFTMTIVMMMMVMLLLLLMMMMMTMMMMMMMMMVIFMLIIMLMTLAGERVKG